MNKTKALLTLIFSALGVFGVNEYYKPKNVKDLLKWKGVKLASSDNVWKSMFFEFEEELIRLGVDSPNSLWTWCNEKFKQHNLSDEKELNLTKKYCSDSAKTIMGRIIREGEEIRLIKENNKEAFSINYLLAENKDEIISLIGFSGEHKPELVGPKLFDWCKSQWKVKINKFEELEKISQFKKRCYDLKIKRISDLLKKQKKRVIDQEEYKRRFNGKLEYVEELKKEIEQFLKENNGKKKQELISLMKISRAQSSEEQEPKDEEILKEYGWLLYKNWCEEKIRASLLEEGVYPSTYGKVVYRCTEEVFS